jgi:phage-related minor tail protein
VAPLADVFVAITGDLGPLRQAARDGGAEAGQTAATGFRGKFEAGIKIAAAASGALLVAGLAGAIQRSNTTGLLAAQVGAAGPQMAKLGKLSGELYAAGYGASIEEVNDALRTVIQNGLAGLSSSEADIKAVASRVSDLTTLLGEDAGRVSSAVQQMLRTGLAKTAEEAFDILTRATQNGINKSEDLLDTLNEYGTEFRELGLDGPRALGLISQAIQAGARDSDTAADALKEFSILAQDGSKKSADAFAALGINAQQAFAAVAGGGAPSAAVLDQVLDKLKAMPANAERTALAVALFGTKAEDLGDALFAMDLDTAVADFGAFEGAAQQAGDTLAGSAGAQVESFKRQVNEGLIDAVSAAIPWLEKMFGWILSNGDVVGPLVTVLGTMAIAVWAINAAITAYTTVQTIALVVANTWLFRTILINTQIAIYIARMAIVRAATVTWTAIQWLLNAAFVANPIGLIVLAIAALVAGVILAYKHSETFRNIVHATWDAIKAAGIAVWNFIKPIFEAWWAFAQRMGSIYLWLWEHAVQPAMRGIGLAIQVAWALIQVVFGLWTIGAQLVGGVIVWLWEHAVQPVFRLIVGHIQNAWTLIKIVWDLLGAYVRNILVPYFEFLWTNAQRIWNALTSLIAGVWNNGIKPVFDFMAKFITQDVPAAWRRGVDLIGFWWGALRDLAKAPVRFIIETVINKGIIGTFNTVAGFFGAKGVNPVNLPSGFATGGQLPGYSDVDNMVAVGPGGKPLGLAGGEWIINARQSRKHGHLLHAINSGMEGFADGGILGAITNPAGWVGDRVNGLISAVPGGGAFRDIVVGTGRRLVTALIDWVKSKLSFGGGGGAAGFPPWPSSPGAQRGDSGVWRTIVALIRSTGPLSGSFGNAYRPGDPLWHGSGRAVDWMGYNQDALATFLAARRPLELIHRTRNRDYAYTRGVNKGSFNQQLMREHENHIHAAFARGGMLRSFDRGGAWPSGTIGANTSGRTEQVFTGSAMDRMERLLERIEAAVDRVGPSVGRELNGGAAVLRQMARARR